MKQLATSVQLTVAIESMAKAIIKDHEKTPLFVCLLRGGAPFSAKLMFEIAKQNPNYHPELDYMTISTYGSGREAKEPRIVTGLAPSTNVAGRDVVVLDDVLDTGTTATFVHEHLKSLGAKNCKLAVLCDKPSKHEYDISADYIGFVASSDNWLTGMGMDDSRTAKEGNRWLEEIQEV